MKKTETLIKILNGKNLYKVVRNWYDVDAREFKTETSYSIRFYGAMYPAWANLSKLEVAEEIMNIPTKVA